MPIHEESTVRSIEVTDGKQVHKASYFIEMGVLHANIGDKIIRLSVGSDTSEDTVRRLLKGHIETKNWRKRMSDKWIDQSE